jgi:murein L,D-transpeptidase YcbB/YkuD
MPLRWWQVGMDWSYGKGAVEAFNRKGYSASLTYPNNSRELHHVNLRKKPFVSIWKIRPLKEGMTNDRVKRVKWMLHVIRDEKGERYLKHRPEDGYGKHFGPDLTTAVRRFQRDHDQKVDGVVGFQTKHQLDTSYRYWKERTGVRRKRSLRRKKR